MKILKHPDKFTTGVRFLSLVSRNKDDVSAPNISRVSYSTEDFYDQLEYLKSMAVEGQRIYASLEERDPSKAIREFKKRQIDADYNPDPLDFYKKLKSCWQSCLMKPSNAKDKYWLLDCDSEYSYVTAKAILKDSNYDRSIYEYNTKNGKHIIVRPFHIRGSFGKVLGKDPLMLWGY